MGSDYKNSIEKDTALGRRFQVVVVEEPSVTETIEILWGLREVYEIYHDLIISDEALTAAVKFSKQYIQDRFLPDKAFDVIDEACAKVRFGDFTFNLVQESQNKKSLLQSFKAFFRDIYNIDLTFSNDKQLEKKDWVNSFSTISRGKLYPNIIEFLESQLTKVLKKKRYSYTK